MPMIGHKRPRKTGRLTVGQDTAESIQKNVMIRIFKNYLSPINPSHHDMVQCSGGVYVGFAWYVTRNVRYTY